MTDMPPVPVTPSPAPSQPLPAPGSLGAWWLAARPKTLVAGWAPVLVGASCAIGFAFGSQLMRGLGALVVALTLQVGTNLVNDAADHARGADTAERLGPPRAVQRGLLTGKQAMVGGLVSFAIAGAVGLGLAAATTWWLLVPGAAAILAGIFYTAGPNPLAYLGLGEVFVFAFFGLFATLGTWFVMLPSVQSVGDEVAIDALRGSILAAAACMGLFAMAILEVNNIRDAPTDRVVGKATLAVRLGDTWARRLFLGFVVGPFVISAILLALPFVSPSFPIRRSTLLVVFLAVPLAIAPIRAVKAGAAGRQLNPVLGQVARLQGAFAILFALGVVLWGMI